MKADLTRTTFDPLKHFSGVLMQQGRIQLDSDWNEQASILLHLQRRFAADLFGPAFSPAGGFAIDPLDAVTDDVIIRSGTYYVDGILCELPQPTPVPIRDWDASARTITVARWTVDEVSFQTGQYLQLWDDAGKKAVVTAKIAKLDYANRELTLDRELKSLVKGAKYHALRLTTYLTQPDLPSPPRFTGGTSLQIYLDVWERLISAIEDQSIREVALGGPDTAARTRVVWQVKWLDAKLNATDDCLSPQALRDRLAPANRGLLSARTEHTRATADPGSGFRGAENQLYRIEIHSGGAAGGTASFKWSRENGSVVFPIAALTVDGSTTRVTLGDLGRDERFALAEGDYVEVQDDHSVLGNIPGALLRVQSIDRASLKVTLAGTTIDSVGAHPDLHPLLRRWDHKPQARLTIGKDGAVPIPSDGRWLDLENGVQVSFDTAGATFRPGDYWMIPARVAIRDVIWPTETATVTQGAPVTNPVATPPDGVTHHYAPLGLVTIADNRLTTRACRNTERPLWKR
jgi:hypothetical protein